jgi:uncharacterized membrane protein YphA (DoxX/SURF4 family)
VKQILSNKYIQLALRFAIGAIFIYASVNKLFSPQDFAKFILRYEMLPVFTVNLMAIILPYVEFVTGILLITGIYKKGASMMAIVSLFVFLIALVSASARSLDISCGCFSLEESSSKGDINMRIIQDVFLLIGAYILYKFSPGKDKEEKVVTGAEESVKC